MKKLLLGLFIFSIFAIGGKAYASNLNLTSSDSGDTFEIKRGQTFKVTLGNPGDGGYTFDDPEYDSSILKLLNHQHINPSYNAAVGNFGQDYWEFEAKNYGKTRLEITASRGWSGGGSVSMFSSYIVVDGSSYNDGCSHGEYYSSTTGSLCYDDVNINPVISEISGPQSLDVNKIGTWIIRATDNTNRNLTYSVDWGDTVYAATASSYQLPQSNQSQSATFSHSYSQAGNYTPTFTVSSPNSIRCITTPCPSNVGSTKVILSVSVGNSNNIDYGCSEGDTYSRTTGKQCLNITPMDSGCVDGSLYSYTTGKACYNANPVIIETQRTLSLGSRGDDVRNLQKFLGIFSDGVFGRNTASNLRNWQIANGLYPDGSFGPMSRHKAGF